MLTCLNDIWKEYIFQYMEKEDLLNLRLTCSKFRNLLTTTYLIDNKILNANEITDLACRTGNKELFQYGLENGANNWIKMFESVCKSKHPEIAKVVVTNSLDIDKWNDPGPFNRTWYIQNVKMLRKLEKVFNLSPVPFMKSTINAWPFFVQ